MESLISRDSTSRAVQDRGGHGYPALGEDRGRHFTALASRSRIAPQRGFEQNCGRTDAHGGTASVPSAAAIRLIESGAFDFVLVDFSMPRHDGVWFMKNVTLPRKTKAVLVTAYIQREVIARMFKLDVAGYLIKPFDERRANDPSSCVHQENLPHQAAAEA